MSYGNYMTEFKFDTGLSLISAKNGCGKTTILEALAFNLFGKPYRNIKISELINRKNKKNLYTESLFEIDGSIYSIIRTLGPAKLEIVKDGVVQDNLSAKKLDQEEINKLLGVDYNIFKLIIALSVNYNRPFLSLGSADKRDVMESIFNIKVFGEMLSKLKKKTASIKSEKMITDGSIKTMEASIKVLHSQKMQLENSIGEFAAKRAEEELRIHEKINAANLKIKSLEASAVDTKKKMEEIVINDVSEDLYRVRSEISRNELKVNELNKQLKFFDSHDECPVCGVIMTQDHKDSEILKLNNEISDIVDKNDRLKAEKALYDEQTTINSNLITERMNHSNYISELVSEAKTVLKTIELYKSQLEENKNRSFDFDTNSITEEYEKQVSEYKSITKISSDLQETLIVNEYVAKMLDDNGIKSYFFKRLIPILNKKINEYLELFELPVSITFNEFMDEKITLQLSSDKDVSYMSFSEGEKKRIDIAILLSFIETTKILSNWNCNVIMFDEVLDNATDSEGLDKLLSSIKDLTSKDSKLCSYIISHRDADSELYDRKISIKKVAGFSKLQETK